MAGAKKLVIGASGFLGPHVTRQLVDRGDGSGQEPRLRQGAATEVVGIEDAATALLLAAMDHGKAERELGWQPKPIHDSICRAAQFYGIIDGAAKTTKTGSRLRMPSAGAGFTIDVCRKSSR